MFTLILISFLFLYSVMYDISDGDERTFADDIRRDWIHLVDDENIIKSHGYLRHHDLPGDFVQ